MGHKLAVMKSGDTNASASEHPRYMRFLLAQLRQFRGDERGNFAMITALLLIPLIFVAMLAMDSANLMRTRNNVQAALDASALAVGKKFATGAKIDNIKAYGKDIFEANLTAIAPAKVVFNIDTPDKTTVKQQVEAKADFPYLSLFGNLSSVLSFGKSDWNQYRYTLTSTVKLKNTVEVALVLDNSGSMTSEGTGTKTQRIALLKDAAKKLVQTLADQSANITNVDKPVQIAVVPFSASVNVGPSYANAEWMDSKGASSIHHENFKLPVIFNERKKIEKKDGSSSYYKIGTGWGDDENQIFTRTQLYKDLQKKSSSPSVIWNGCVEARPGKYGLNADVPNPDVPDTMFVPMFAPDEASNGLNNWWNDDTTLKAKERQRDVKKYYNLDSKKITAGPSPNYSCTTTPLTPLLDITSKVLLDKNETGLEKVKKAIDDMVTPRNAYTNVPEGLVWGWRALIQNAPFTQGRPSTDRGNDKVVIVLTDGDNTYSKYGSSDDAGNKSTYAAYGYTGVTKRIFEHPDVSVVYSEAQYTFAMNEKFSALCQNAKNDNIVLMTIALDLSETAQKSQIKALKACSSDSRVRREDGKPAKLFWNTTGKKLDETFRQIGDELSNLRIVG